MIGIVPGLHRSVRGLNEWLLGRGRMAMNWGWWFRGDMEPGGDSKR